MILLTGVKKCYGGRTVLDIERLVINGGERVAIIGPNGSGKSTLLMLMGGIMKPDAGNIETADQKIGYLPQTPYAFHRSVKGNVKLCIRAKKDREKTALQALDAVGLTALQNAGGRNLSGGETQRMALARLFATRPDTLLLDEPTSATDIAGNDLIENALLCYADDNAACLVFSSHAPGQALRLATRVIVLLDGRIAEDGAPEQVLHAPKSDEVRRFLAHWKF